MFFLPGKPPNAVFSPFWEYMGLEETQSEWEIHQCSEPPNPCSQLSSPKVTTIRHSMAKLARAAGDVGLERKPGEVPSLRDQELGCLSQGTAATHQFWPLAAEWFQISGQATPSLSFLIYKMGMVMLSRGQEENEMRQGKPEAWSSALASTCYHITLLLEKQLQTNGQWWGHWPPWDRTATLPPNPRTGADWKNAMFWKDTNEVILFSSKPFCSTVEQNSVVTHTLKYNCVSVSLWW